MWKWDNSFCSLILSNRNSMIWRLLQSLQVSIPSMNTSRNWSLRLILNAQLLKPLQKKISLVINWQQGKLEKCRSDLNKNQISLYESMKLEENSESSSKLKVRTLTISNSVSWHFKRRFKFSQSKTSFYYSKLRHWSKNVTFQKFTNKLPL